MTSWVCNNFIGLWYHMGYLLRNDFFCIVRHCKLLNPEKMIIYLVVTTISIKWVSFCSFFPNRKELGPEISEWWSEKYDDSYGTKIAITLKKWKQKGLGSFKAGRMIKAVEALLQGRGLLKVGWWMLLCSPNFLIFWLAKVHDCQY